MDLIVRKARLADDKPLMDVGVSDGKFAAIEPHLPDGGAKEIFAEGRVLIPGLVEGHLHLEKALIKDRMPNRSGTLQEAIAVTGKLKPTFSAEDIYERARTALTWLVRNGSTHLRAESEFDPSQGFVGFEVTLALKQEFKHCLDIQICAFPQEGIFKVPGTEQMMHQALRSGADVCGGIPYNDTDPHQHIDLLFRLAKEYGVSLDVHQDFADDADAMSIEYLARKTIQEGYEGRVVVGHLTALGAVEPERQKSLCSLIADAGISVMCLPATDLHLGGRNDAYNVRRALTPVRALRKAGVNVCLASNNIRNAFTPYNNGDVMQIGMLAVVACHLGGADDLPTVLPMLTVNPAKALELKGYGIEVGNEADMVLLDTYRVEDAVIDQPEKLYVFKRGKLTVQRSVSVQCTYF